MDGRILLLSWTVPPETTGSAVIIGNLARQFSRAEMVVAGERPHGRPPIAWKDEWPEIIYVTTGWPQTWRGARWHRKAQIPLLLLRCLQIVRRYRCTRLLVVFPNDEFLLVGYLVARMMRLSFYGYFHNTYVEQCAEDSWRYRFALWLQQRVFERARHIFVMSEGMVQLYRERYPHLNCSALVHSFNENIPEFIPPGRLDPPIHFVLCGNINASCVDAAVRVCKAIGRIGGRLTVLSGTSKRYLMQLGILREGVRYETVSRDRVLNRLSEADVAVLAHGFTGSLAEEEYRTIFPTRTIEYLISGRPILAHTPANCYLTRFLREHNCALICEEPSEEAILEQIHRLMHDGELRAALVKNALRVAERFRARTVASRLRLVLEQDGVMPVWPGAANEAAH